MGDTALTADAALPPDAREVLRSLDEPSRGIAAAFPLDRLVGELDALSGAAAGALELAPAARVVASARASFGAAAAGAYAKRLVLTLVGEHPARLRRIALPGAVAALVPDTLHRIARRLALVPHASYVASHGEVAVRTPGHADFWRDLRLAALLTVPLTPGRVMDRASFLPPTFYRHMGARENLRCLRLVVLRLHGLGPLFRMHIDEREAAHFDEASWECAYLRAAEMLELHPSVKGTVSTSWTLDPALDRISPRRSYGRRVQAAHGGFHHREGPSELATERALKRSATRRELYERGEYVPTNYTSVWPRRDLLRWAASRTAAAGPRGPAPSDP